MEWQTNSKNAALKKPKVAIFSFGTNHVRVIVKIHSLNQFLRFVSQAFVILRIFVNLINGEYP